MQRGDLRGEPLSPGRGGVGIRVTRQLATILLTLVLAAGVALAGSAPDVRERIAARVAVNHAAGRPAIAYVMNGGGARALATAGMLEVLEEAGIRPDFITGASMGSIVGYLYATGLSATELTRRIAEAPLYDGIALALPGAGGTLDPGRAAALLVTLGASPGHRLESLPTPLAMTVTDLRSERAFYPVRGPALDWALVSAALPGALPPAVSGSLVLADGGILVNSPSDLARALGADLIIEFGRRRGTTEEAPPPAFDDRDLRALLATARPATPVDPTSTGAVLAWAAYLNAGRASGRAPGPDLIAIEAPVDTFPLLAFDHAAYFVEAGRREARSRLPAVQAWLREASWRPGQGPRPPPTQQPVEPLDVNLAERVRAYPIVELEFAGRRFDFRSGPGPLGGSRLGVGTTGPALSGVAFEFYATDAGLPGFGIGARWNTLAVGLETGPALRLSAGPVTLRGGPEGTALGLDLGDLAGGIEFLPAGLRAWATGGGQVAAAGPLWVRGRVSAAGGPPRSVDPGGGNPARGIPPGALAGSWALVFDADLGVDLVTWSPPNTLLTGRVSLVPFAGLAGGEPGWALLYGVAVEGDLRVYGLLPLVLRLELAGPYPQLAARVILR